MRLATIGWVHDDEKAYPTAEVYLTVDGQTYVMPVVLIPKLPYAVILGSVVPLLLNLTQQAQANAQLDVLRHQVKLFHSRAN